MIFGLFCLLATSTVPVAQAEAAEEWSGGYAGINGGYGSARISGIFFNTSIGSADASGGAIGAQAGYDQQAGAWVFGIQLSADRPFFSGSHLFVNGTGPTNRVTYKVDFLATATGRIGYLLQPETLAYLKAGGAIARTTYTDEDPLAAPPYTGSARAMRDGWLIGAGLEHKISSNLSGYAEYNYMDFGSKALTISYTGGYPSFAYTFKQELNFFGLGVNYRF